MLMRYANLVLFHILFKWVDEILIIKLLITQDFSVFHVSNFDKNDRYIHPAFSQQNHPKYLAQNGILRKKTQILQ